MLKVEIWITVKNLRKCAMYCCLLFCQEMTNVEHREAIKKVFVGGIGQDTQDHHLREYFSQYGTVQTASVMTDKITGNSRGFGFVVFESADAVDQLCSMSTHLLLDIMASFGLYKFIWCLQFLTRSPFLLLVLINLHLGCSLFICD